MRLAKLCILLVFLCTGCAASPALTQPPLVQIASITPQTAVQPTSHNATPVPTLTPLPESLVDLARAAYGGRLIEQVMIPALRLDAPVKPVGWQLDITAPEQTVWDSPEASVGWAVTSALPGDGGLIFLYGHNNIDSSVFQTLYLLQTGDEITLQTGESNWVYQTNQVTILPVGSLEENQKAVDAVFQTGQGERLVLLSCWPPDNNTHRVIVTAKLVRSEQ